MTNEPPTFRPRNRESNSLDASLHASSSQPRRRLALVVLLRTVGFVDCLAAAAVLLPSDGMDAVHRALGMGALPREPIVDYLARSLSMMYVFRGVLYLYAAADVEARRGLIAVLAWTSVAMGPVLLAIDLAAGMPPSWTWTEWVLVLVPGLLLLLLLARTRNLVDNPPDIGHTSE